MGRESSSVFRMLTTKHRPSNVSKQRIFPSSKLDIQKKLLSNASDHVDKMAVIEETATDENTKLCASCSGQLANFYKQFHTLADAICKEEYEQTKAQARDLVDIAKSA